MMEFPEVARAMAWPMLLQAVREDLQLLLSLPLAPFTYHVVLAKADGDTAKNSTMNSPLFVISLGFITGGRMRRQWVLSVASLCEAEWVRADASSPIPQCRPHGN